MKKLFMFLLLIALSCAANFASAGETSGKVIVLKREDVPQIYTTVGTIRSRDEIDLSSRITARIVDVTKWSGDTVKKEEVLIRLDAEDLTAARNRLTADLKKAEAALHLAQTQYKRAKILYASKAVSKSSYDQAEKNLAAAEANVAAVKREIDLAETRLSYAVIKSPFNGIVAERFANPGDMAAPSKVLMTVFDPSKLMLYASISESLVKKIKKGDDVEMYIDALRKKITGKIVEIVPSVDVTSRTFTVKIWTKENKNLMPGMFGTFYLPIGHTKELLIPENAIIRIGQLEYAEIATNNGKTQSLMIRTVPCHFEPGKRKVISGLKEGMKIVLQNH